MRGNDATMRGDHGNAMRANDTMPTYDAMRADDTMPIYVICSTRLLHNERLRSYYTTRGHDLLTQ